MVIMVSLQEFKEKLSTVEKELRGGRKNKSISLKKASDLINKASKEGEGFKKADIDQETEEFAAAIVVEFIWINNDWAKRWQKEKTHPTQEELDIMKKKDFRQIVDELRKDLPSFISEEVHQDLSSDIKEIKDFIQQEENYQKSPHIPQSNNDENGNNDRTNDKGKGGGDRPSSSDNYELDKKIKNLQNQLNIVKAELEKKQQQNPNSSDSLRDERKKEELERELERLNRAKENNENRRGQKQQSKGDFPYGLVIGGGIVIFILLMAVILLWQKSKRR